MSPSPYLWPLPGFVLLTWFSIEGWRNTPNWSNAFVFVLEALKGDPPCVPEYVPEPVFWSTTLSAFPLAWVEVEKKNHNLLACPSKRKGNLLSWRQTTRPHWFNEANSLGKISFHPDLSQTLRTLLSLGGPQREFAWGQEKLLPTPLPQEFVQLEGAKPPKKHTLQTAKRNSSPQWTDM